MGGRISIGVLMFTLRVYLRDDLRDEHFRAVSYLPNIFKCLEADALGGEAFFREKSSCLFHLLQILRNRKVFRVNE